jgi:hypothetical protein
VTVSTRFTPLPESFVKTSITTTLLAAVACSAIPLRKGASLGYQVNQTHFTTLTVTDSLATDTGTLWNVMIRDSTPDTIQIDSALAWNRGADTVWRRSSFLVPWDLSPLGSWDPTGTRMFPPGMNTGLIGTFTKLQVLDGVRTWETWRTDRGYYTIAYKSPYILLAPDTGIFRYFDPYFCQDWVLKSVAGATPKPHAWDSAGRIAVSLEPGQSWAWSVDSSGSRRTIQWTIFSASVDSEGWIRRRITAGTDSFELLLNPYQGRTICHSDDGLTNLLCRGMMEVWYDSPFDANSNLRTDTSYHDSYAPGTIRYFWNSTSMRIDPALGPVEILLDSLPETSPAPLQVQISMIQHNGMPVSRSAVEPRTKITVLPALRGRMDLERFLGTHPSAIVRILTASGKSIAPLGDGALRGLQGMILVQIREGNVSRTFQLAIP